MKISGLILGVLSLVAYSQGAESSDAKNVEKFSSASNFFGLELFNELRAKEGNLLFSPLSAHAALSLTYSGSSNETAAEMRSALRLNNENPSRGTRGYASLLMKIWNPKNDDLYYTTRLFVDPTIPVKGLFKSNAISSFYANVHELNLRREPERSRLAINKMVENLTYNKIHNLLSKGDLTSDTTFVLVSALYFKGDWAVAFPATNTGPQTFRLNSKSTKEVDMMSVTDSFNYAKTPDFAAVSLDYRKNDTSMVILLPNDVDGLPQLEASLPNVDWGHLEQEMATKTELTVTLPKFKLEKSMDLKPYLKKMGIKRAFDRKFAQFPGITESATSLDKVAQKTFLEVDEKGTEAAAATNVQGMVYHSATIYPKFTADHPFLFFIWHKPSQTVLFMGRYSQPQ